MNFHECWPQLQSATTQPVLRASEVGGGERLIKFNFSAVKLLAQRPIRISAVATVLLVIKTFAVKYEREKLGGGGGGEGGEGGE